MYPRDVAVYYDNVNHVFPGEFMYPRDVAVYYDNVNHVFPGEFRYPRDVAVYYDNVNHVFPGEFMYPRDVAVFYDNVNHVFPGEFRYPRDVAVCPLTGRVMVADADNRRIQILDNQLKHIKDITQDGDGKTLSRPAGVCFNSKGDIIVSDTAANRVLVYDTTGSYTRDIVGPWHDPWGIAVDSDDKLYVCDRDSSDINVIGKDGKRIRTFRLEGTTSGRFVSAPFHVTVHGDELVVSAAGGRVLFFTVEGVFIKELESGVVKWARGLDVGPSGELIIVDDEGLLTVMREGRVVSRLGECGDEPWKLNWPQGVAVTKTGQAVVANMGNHNLLIYDIRT